MLEPAIKYKEQLQHKLDEALLSDAMAYSYYDPSYVLTGIKCNLNIEPNTMSKHQFVSVHNGEVVGFISYNISFENYRAYNFQTISFNQNTVVFAVDFKRAIVNIFELYKFRKLNFSVFVGNPIEQVYDAKIEKYFGGRIVGVQKDHCRLADGKFHDLKLYEILRKDYLQVRDKRNKLIE